MPIPIVSGHRGIAGVTNIALNHKRTATLALEYLRSLGHRKVAFIKAQAFSSDTEVGRRVPEDVSVVGFDDIESAAFENPALTTIRQPFRQMRGLAEAWTRQDSHPSILFIVARSTSI